MTTPFLLLQLADGTFPSGGFAHSAGLEASAELGGLGAHDATDALDAFVDDAIVQATHATLPFVRAACLDPSHLAELDDAFDATVPLDVPNRASRALGRALASAFGRVFDAPAIAVITAHTRRAPAHHAPVFGALYGALAIDPEEAATAYLHGTVRALLSAAVRLGLVGPLEAQRMHHAREAAMRAALARTDLTPDDVATTAPLVELWGALHDRLDARLFQS